MHPASHSRRFAIAALAVASLAGCAPLTAPRSLTLTEADLARWIEKRFPADRRLMEVIDFHIDAPRVRLLPESNRIATEFGLQASDRLFGRSFKGRFVLDGALRYDAPTHEVRLTQVRVESLQFDGMPAPMQATVNRLGGLLAEQLLDEVAVHRFKPEDIERAQRLGLQPGAVTVTPRGVEIALVPIKP